VAEPWLHIVGIGEDGMAGLVPAARAVVEAADVIVGGDRHHDLSDTVTAERISWPSPFDALIDLLTSMKGRRVVVLATGDPLWYSVGARIGRAIDPAGIVYHPQVSAFQLAAARMGWSMADLETLTVHGRPVEQMIAFIQPEARLLVLTTGEETPARIARFLTERGFGQSRMSVLASMGGPDEARFDGVAETWDHVVPAFNTLAVACVAGPDAALLPRTPGLADGFFRHDGTMTKRDLRAATLARLMPMRGALLWDIGCGCGSVAVEWMRAARDARAIGVEPRADRRVLAAANAQALGAPALELIDGADVFVSNVRPQGRVSPLKTRFDAGTLFGTRTTAALGAPALELIDGRAPAALQGLARPDAVFVGGGLSPDVFETAWDALRPLGRFVCNAVTLESEAVLQKLFRVHGGELARLQVTRAEPVGGRTGWRPMMPVTQWSLIKR